MVEMDHMKLVEDQIGAWLMDLGAEADRIADAHWKVVMEMERKQAGWQGKSALQLRCRLKGNSLKIEWTGIRWTGSKAKGNRRPLREYIKQGGGYGGYGYNIKLLHKYSREWEKLLVEDTEKQMAEIRRKARHLTKALQLVRFACSANGEGNLKGDGDE